MTTPAGQNKAEIPLVMALRKLDTEEASVRQTALSSINALGSAVFQTLYRQHCLPNADHRLPDTAFAALDRGDSRAIDTIRQAADGAGAFGRIADRVQRQLVAQAAPIVVTARPSIATSGTQNSQTKLDTSITPVRVGIKSSDYRNGRGTLYDLAASTLCGISGGVAAGIVLPIARASQEMAAAPTMQAALGGLLVAAVLHPVTFGLITRATQRQTKLLLAPMLCAAAIACNHAQPIGEKLLPPLSPTLAQNPTTPPALYAKATHGQITPKA